LFDEQDFRIKIDEEGKIIQESTDMRLLMDTVPAPSQIIDHDNKVYLMKEGFIFSIIMAH
jgi:hypothetical protein